MNELRQNCAVLTANMLSAMEADNYSYRITHRSVNYIYRALNRFCDDNYEGLYSQQAGKNGILYVNASGENDNNNTLRVALHNRAFLQYLESEDTLETLADAAMSQYVDIAPEETMKAVYMGIISSENRWDEGITKTEAIEFLVSTLEAEHQHRSV